jgi:AbrB family looped-hinge helix DNA binding protein
MIIGRVSKKGQIVIPKEIRDMLRIKEGDYVIFRVDGKRIYLEKIEERTKDVLKSAKPVESSVEFQRKLREEWD